MEQSDLRVLRAVRLRLVAQPDHVAVATGADLAEVEAALATLATAELVQETPRGWRLTPAGQARLTELLDAERAGVDEATARAVHADFVVLDGEFKQLVTDQQMAADPAAALAGTTEQLTSLHERARPVRERGIALAPRLSPFETRFSGALVELQGGDARYLAHPMLDSYHTVWFEFHEELIHLAGLSRAAQEASGHGA